MGQDFKEIAHLKTDKKRYDKNFDRIVWSNKDKPTKEVGVSKCGICKEEMLKKNDCGGDCVYCMAIEGDPQAIEKIILEDKEVEYMLKLAEQNYDRLGKEKHKLKQRIKELESKLELQHYDAD